MSHFADPVVAKQFEVEVKGYNSDPQFIKCDFNNILMCSGQYCYTDEPQTNWTDLPEKSSYYKAVLHNAVLFNYQNRLNIFFPQSEKLFRLNMPEIDLTIAKFFVIREEEKIRLVAYTNDPCPVIAVWDFSSPAASAGKKKRKKAQMESIDFSNVTPL